MRGLWCHVTCVAMANEQRNCMVWESEFRSWRAGHGVDACAHLAACVQQLGGDMCDASLSGPDLLG